MRGILLLLSLSLPIIALNACGNNHSDGPRSEEIQRLKEEKARLENELHTNQQERQRLTTALAAANADLETKNQALAKARDEVKDLQDRLIVAPGNAELAARLRDRLADVSRLEGEVNTLRRNKDTIQSELDKMKREQEANVAFVERLVKPLQGLWQSDMLQSLNGQNICKLFYLVEKALYQRLMVCRQQDSFPFSYEVGHFIDLIKLAPEDETETTLNVHRRVATHWRSSSCTHAFLADSVQSPLAETDALSWTKGNSESLTAIFAGNLKPITTMHGDEGLQTMTCEQILARPQRQGLEEAVAACQLLKDPSAIAKNPMLGCFNDQNGHLIWQAQAITTRGS